MGDNGDDNSPPPPPPPPPPLPPLVVEMGLDGKGEDMGRRGVDDLVGDDVACDD